MLTGQRAFYAYGRCAVAALIAATALARAAGEYAAAALCWSAAFAVLAFLLAANWRAPRRRSERP